MKNIIIKGAREHNLKNIDITIPRNKLVVLTGVSGSGKSSLAFDTIFAEGQRRYVESLSTYARQFLQQLQKPDLDYIEGLSPAISIGQKTIGHNPRSTVGTITDIYDYLRLLFARVGKAHCYSCGTMIASQSVQEIADQIINYPLKTKIQLLASVVKGRKGTHEKLLASLRSSGFLKIRINKDVFDLSDKIELKKNVIHDIDVVVDRIVIKKNIFKRLFESVETALKLGSGLLIVQNLDSGTERIFSELSACPQCGISYGEISPRMFSFNSPYGACPLCHGIGTIMCPDAELVTPDVSMTLNEGAVEPWLQKDIPNLNENRKILKSLSEKYGFSLDIPYIDIPKNFRDIILHGSKGEFIDIPAWRSGKQIEKREVFKGVLKILYNRWCETDSYSIKNTLARYMIEQDCPDCKGTRLRKESLSITIAEKNIIELSLMTIDKLKQFFDSLDFTGEKAKISYELLKEIRSRLQFLQNVGLSYLSLDRKSSTLAGGEAQRIRLATQIGSGLVGVLYILDEPTIGLHQKDNERLLKSLIDLRDLGNSIIIVEHDEETITKADHIIDLGPGAGNYGGHVLCSGSLDEIKKCSHSLTGKYLSKKLNIAVPKKRRPLQKTKIISLKGCREHNLKNIDITIPLGVFTAVTGVSGSGKSTLVSDILYNSLHRKINRANVRQGDFDSIHGTELIDKLQIINQSPIGKTPRSNPATYTDLFNHIRLFFSELPEAKVRGYGPGRFSFNVKGGRCETCHGAGTKKIEMHFLPDVYVQCEACKGERYNRETLQVTYKGKNITDILNSTVDEAIMDFKNFPQIHSRLKMLKDVGLGYIKLGQPSNTLSGGEAQRVKLSAELAKKSTGNTFYILDEPTTGLHFADIHLLLHVLQKLVDMGNTVLVIEHNLDVIKCADHIIDLGPEGGNKGGEVIATGTPEEITFIKKSYTGEFLKKVLTDAF
ncbi:MAG: excinuclease ABC subunit UvrA [Candidatus Aureabacteria bacterium]|nr:excinuclease ABC subunit UvrA [Candidatus Auribacterota bacterium]